MVLRLNKKKELIFYIVLKVMHSYKVLRANEQLDFKSSLFSCNLGDKLEEIWDEKSSREASASNPSEKVLNNDGVTVGKSKRWQNCL